MTTEETNAQSPSRGRIVAEHSSSSASCSSSSACVANWVKREALDPETFSETSQELIAHPVQDQLAATMVEQLYANVDVAARLEERLPENLQSLAAPIAGISREAIDRAARELLDRPRVQSPLRRVGLSRTAGEGAGRGHDASLHRGGDGRARPPAARRAAR